MKSQEIGLQLKGVGKAFGTVRVVQDLDLDVFQGEFVVLLGESGCGKSTTLRMIAG
ncbi:MAG TPA: ATP-binding cassette domain-containing protein, partial [Rubrivivax sp.]|nr:ATP-binding cassette domain-containing protein [Rubrivivax sp.]